MTPYDVLSVSQDATPDQVEKAWKAAVRANHPDLFGGAMRDNKSAYVARINAAYDQIQNLRASAERNHARMRAAKDAEAPKTRATSRPKAAPAGAARAARQNAGPRPGARPGPKPGAAAAAKAAARGNAPRFATWAASRLHEIDTAEYADLRHNAYRIVARNIGEQLFRSLATALTFGICDGRFTLAPLVRLPRFPNAFLPWKVRIESGCINLFCLGVPIAGDTVIVPKVEMVEGRPRLSREHFTAVAYRGWDGALTYRACGTSQEGLDISGEVEAPEGMPVRLFFLREYANPTTRAAIATSPLLSLSLNWLYRLRS